MCDLEVLLWCIFEKLNQTKGDEIFVISSDIINQIETEIKKEKKKSVFPEQAGQDILSTKDFFWEYTFQGCNIYVRHFLESL